MSKKLMSEAHIARFKQLAGIPLTESEVKLKNKLLTEGVYEEELDEAKEEEGEEELDEAQEEEGEEEEGMEEEDEAADDEMAGEEEDEEVELDDEAGELEAGDVEDGMEGGDAEALIQSLLTTVQELANKLGVQMQIDGGGEEHAEPDADQMGGPSDMDADNMGDEDAMADGAELDMADEEEGEEEELAEGDGQIPYDAEDRRPDARAPHGLSESAIRAITSKVSARLNESNTSLSKEKIVEMVTNRVAARLVAEAKKAKKSIKEKMASKKGGKGNLKAEGKGSAAKAGHGPGSTQYGVKGGKVANKYELKDVKVPSAKKSHTGGNATTGKGKTKLPKATGKAGK